MYSPANVHAVFAIQTVKFCTRLPCALAKTSPDVSFFCLIFVSQDFSGNVDHLSPNVFGEKKKRKNPRRSDLAMGL